MPCPPHATPAATPAVPAVLADAIARHAGFARASLARAVETFGTPWIADAAALVETLYPEPQALADAARGYAAFALDSMRRQKRFERDRRYPARSHAEATAEVYDNDDYMRTQYLPGLLLSHLLWPHHYRQLQYFRDLFLPALARRAPASIAEVGVGTGLYSRVALQALPAVRGTGYDISAMSLAFTREHLQRFGLGARYTALREDVLRPAERPRHDAVICVEVLEHLDDPSAMLRALARLAAPGAPLFVTAALNAANADHIHLYRSPDEVLDQARDAGLHVEHAFVAQAYAPPAPGVPVPAALAMVAMAQD